MDSSPTITGALEAAMSAGRVVILSPDDTQQLNLLSDNPAAYLTALVSQWQRPVILRLASDTIRFVAPREWGRPQLQKWVKAHHRQIVEALG